MKKKTSELSIFFAYARVDQALRNRLDIHLSGMKRKNYIKTWFDGKIEPSLSILRHTQVK